MDKVYSVYVRTDEAGRIIAINSDIFLASLEGWTKIDEGIGIRYEHAQGNYLPNTITDDRGIFRYKLDGTYLVERSTEEMDADYAAQPAPEQTTEELLLETAGDHEYRLCLIELGVNDNDL